MKTKLKLLIISQLLAAIFFSASAQNTVVTYQGRVTDNGTNFNGTGQFKFALLTSTNHNHTARGNAGFQLFGIIQTFILVDGGNGYLVPPTVTITGGGGSGAAVTANISGGVVTSLNFISGGSNYTSLPTVTISPPPDYITVTTHWSNDGTSSGGSEPTGAVSASVTNGLFTVGLGDTTLANMTALNAALFQRTDLQLRLWFSDGVNGFAPLSPLQNLTAAPYANYAYAATTLTAAGNQPLNFTVNGTNVLRITSVNDFVYGQTVNSMGGSSANVISNGVVGGFIGGGGNSFYPNRVGANYASVLGGFGNAASGDYSTAMGVLTTASGDYSTAMGASTTASGLDSTAMGSFTTASGIDSTAMGNRAKALHDGTFVWADSQSADFASTRANQFAIRAAGGVVMNVGSSGLNPAGVFINSTSANGVALYAAQSSSDAAIVIANGGTGDLIKAFNGVSGNPVFEVVNDGTVYSKGFALTSDRNAKEKFVPVDGRDVLAKIATLPLTEWTYKTDPSGTRHIGPMAQDFHAAFGLNGSDDKHISVVDESGVALAAIQGLNEKVEQKNAEITELKRELEKLKKVVDKLVNAKD
ncbi:MAG: hypothetical protein HOP33_19775 [Verrucomicrobia bacterium]|nr:hypothetical protein [Verrucomicrobiota bacterium]